MKKIFLILTALILITLLTPPINLSMGIAIILLLTCTFIAILNCKEGKTIPIIARYFTIFILSCINQLFINTQYYTHLTLIILYSITILLLTLLIYNINNKTNTIIAIIIVLISVVFFYPIKQKINDYTNPDCEVIDDKFIDC